jgi:phage tail tape-measure protein
LRPGPAAGRWDVQQSLERFSSMGMDAVAAILIFLVAMLALNRFEFGRFD